MHVTFGLFLDARQGPSPTNFFNTPVVGRLGFLSLLETYLGLSAPEASTARRVAIYSGLLRAHDNNSRFYSESLKADSIGTAATSLRQLQSNGRICSEAVTAVLKGADELACKIDKVKYRYDDAGQALQGYGPHLRHAQQQSVEALRQAEAAVQSAAAGVEEARNALARHTLGAPFAGTVSELLPEVGELVAPGMAVAQLGGGGWVVETTDLVELDVVHVEVGQPVEVTLDALPGETLRGAVIDVGRVPEVTLGDVTYRVRVALDDVPDDLPLRWGMTALVNIRMAR